MPIMRNESGERHPEARVVVARVGPMIGPQCHVRVFPAAPVASGLLAHGGILIMQQAVVGGDQVAVTFCGGYTVLKTGPIVWKVPTHVAGHPTHLTVRGRHNAEEDHLGDAFG